MGSGPQDDGTVLEIVDGLQDDGTVRQRWEVILQIMGLSD